MTYTIGQRVSTKFGAGTIVEFERLTHPITYFSEYAEGDRVAVLLDEPTRWAHGKGNPHFLPSDLKGSE
jgi:hypothetical protein